MAAQQKTSGSKSSNPSRHKINVKKKIKRNLDSQSPNGSSNKSSKILGFFSDLQKKFSARRASTTAQRQALSGAKDAPSANAEAQPNVEHDEPKDPAHRPGHRKINLKSELANSPTGKLKPQEARMDRYKDKIPTARPTKVIIPD
jgi:hypothetical protein